MVRKCPVLDPGMRKRSLLGRSSICVDLCSSVAHSVFLPRRSVFSVSSVVERLLPGAAIPPPSHRGPAPRAGPLLGLSQADSVPDSTRRINARLRIPSPGRPLICGSIIDRIQIGTRNKV